MLTRAADYAVRVMLHLAALPSGTRLSRADLASTGDVPDSFMSKVLQALVRARLISSRSGINGGFELAVSPEDITLLDVIEAIDGPIELNVCVGASQSCGRQSWCAAHLVWMQAQQAMTSILKSATIAQLAAQSEKRKALAARAGRR